MIGMYALHVLTDSEAKRWFRVFEIVGQKNVEDHVRMALSVYNTKIVHGDSGGNGFQYGQEICLQGDGYFVIYVNGIAMDHRLAMKLFF